MKLSEEIEKEINAHKSKEGLYRDDLNYLNGRIDGFKFLLPKIKQQEKLLKEMLDFIELIPGDLEDGNYHDILWGAKSIIKKASEVLK